MTHPYLTLLRTPQLPVRFCAVFLSALTLGMMTLTVVLCVRGWAGSFALAGLASGLFSAGNAVGISAQGHLLGRLGGRRVIVATALVFSVAIAAFVTGGQAGSTPTVLVAAAVAGLAVPAVTAAVRAWLPTALAAQRDRTASYALLSLTFQAALAVGPLLVSACVLLLGPSLAAVVAAVLVLGAAAAYSRNSTGPAPTRRPRSRPAPKGTLDRGLLTVLAVAGLTGAAYGSLLVLVPTVMTNKGTPALAGVVFAMIAVGEASGAPTYGSRHWRAPRTHHLLVTLPTSGLACAAAALATSSTLLLAVVLLAFGAAAGPVAIVLSALLDDVAPPDQVARAYSLMVTTTLVAIAAGSSLTGVLVDLAAPGPLFALPAALSALAATAALTRLSSLEHPAPHTRS